jgi:Na+/proline symporter
MRYSKSVSVLYTVVSIFQIMVNLGVMLKGSSAMITAVSGGAINPALAIFAMTALFLVYGLAGGLSAAIMTDFLQGMLTIVLSVMLVPFALSAVGGMDMLRQTVGRPEMFEIIAPGEITLFYIAVIVFNGLVGWPTMPHHMGLCGAGKTELEGRFGVTVGMFLKRFCTIAWVIVGICAVAIYAGKSIDEDQIYGLMARDLLPAIAPGLIGLFIASLLAAVMSTCDTLMVTSAALFTENIYRPFFGKGRDDRHFMKVGRITSIIIVVLGIFFAFNLQSVVHGIEIFWKISAMMGIAFWGGLIWRRATVAGAWAGTLVSFTILLFTSKISILGLNLWDFDKTITPLLPDFMCFDNKLYLPWQMLTYISAGLVTMIVVSIFSRRVASQRLDRVFECIRTPIGPDEPETEPFSLPPGVKPAPRNNLIKHPDFEIPKPLSETVIGFVLSCAAVGGLIGFVYWIFN